MKNYIKKFVDLSNGERYAFLKEGVGEPLLMVHGNMSSSVHYSPLLPALSQRFCCVVPDMRGFGDSSFFKPFYSLKELADDLKLFCDALKIKSAFVVAWSAGGGVALELAAKYPSLVKSLFCIEGASHRGYPIFKKDEKGLNIEGETYASVKEMSFDSVQVAPIAQSFKDKNCDAVKAFWDAAIYVNKRPKEEDNNFYLTETVKQVCLPYLDWALANFNMSDKPTPYSKGDNSIKNVKCPVMLTTGDKDLVVPKSMVMQNLESLPNAKLICYDNCGHSPLVDCPQKLTNDILEFFC